MEQTKENQPENKNCFNTHDWYQDSCDNLKAMHLTLKQTSCIPFDIHIDSAASLRTLTKDDFKQKAFSVGLTSYDLLDDEMAIQTTYIKLLRKRVKSYIESQSRFHNAVKTCADARQNHFEHCKDCPGWYENQGHEFARTYLLEADAKCVAMIKDAGDFLKMAELFYDNYLNTSTPSLNDNNILKTSDSRKNTSPGFSVKEHIFTDAYNPYDDEEEKKDLENRRASEKEARAQERQKLKDIKDAKKREKLEQIQQKLELGDEYFYNVRQGILKLDINKAKNADVQSFGWIKDFENVLKSYNKLADNSRKQNANQEIDIDQRVFDGYVKRVRQYDPPINLLAYGDFDSEPIKEFFQVLVDYGKEDNVILWGHFFEPFAFYQDEKTTLEQVILHKKDSFGRTGYAYIRSERGNRFLNLFLAVYFKKAFQKSDALVNDFLLKLMFSLLDTRVYEQFLTDVSTSYKHTPMTSEEQAIVLNIIDTTRQFLRNKIWSTNVLFQIWKTTYGPHDNVCRDIYDAYQRLHNMIHNSKGKQYTFTFKGMKLRLKLVSVTLDEDKKLKEMAKWYEENCLSPKTTKKK
jgi:hypothetical protein